MPTITKRRLTTFTILTLLILLPFSVYLAKKSQNLGSKAGGETSIAFYFAREGAAATPLGEISLETGQTSRLELYADANAEIGGFDISATFPAEFTPTQIVPGSDIVKFNRQVLTSYDQNTRTARVVAVNTQSEQVAQGLLHLATLTFQAAHTPTTGTLNVTRLMVVAPTSPQAIHSTFNQLVYTIARTTPTPIPTLTPTPTSPEPTQTPTPTFTPIPTPTPTSLPSLTPTSAPTPTTGSASLQISLRFQGIDRGGYGVEENSLVELQSTTSTTKTESRVTFTGDENGLFHATLTGITLSPDTYDVYVTGPAHLRVRVGSITLVSGTNTLDVISIELLPGDLTGDGKIDLFDFNEFVEDFGPRMPTTGSPADFDRNGKVDLFDYNLFVPNYGKTGE